MSNHLPILCGEPKSPATPCLASLVLALCLVLSVSENADANPPLANPSFEIIGPAGSPTLHAPTGGQSAAESWGVFHNTVPSTTTTEVSPSTLPGAGFRMICVETDGVSNGLNQVTGGVGSGAAHGIGSGWVWIRSGTVGMGTGNHGNTGIDVQTSVVGAWQYLQSPNGVSPMNQIVFYSVGGGAEFCVEEADMLELQDSSPFVPVEYSNDIDEKAIPGGGGHAGPDSGQILYTEPVDTPADMNPRDVHDFFPAIEDFEPDAQVDALANGGDGGFQDLTADLVPLLISLTADPTGANPIAVYREDIDGFAGAHYTQRDLDALDPLGPEIEDLDALEMWGDTGSIDDPSDSNYYSLEFDFSASVWFDDGGGPVVYLTPGDIVGAVNQLGFDGQPGDADVDALMVQDTGPMPGTWDEGDAVIFSIRPFGAWDGGEIVVWEFGLTPQFLEHGGHVWDTSFGVAALFGVDIDHENVDAIETIPVPEPGAVGSFLCGALLLGTLNRRRVA